MLSAKARAVRFLLRHRHWFRLQLRPPQVDWTDRAAVLRFREKCEEGAQRFGKVPDDIETRSLSIDGIGAEWLMPRGAHLDPAILYFHGGGYVAGSCSDHRVPVAKFVQGTGIAALQFDYRLAPEHPYPAALEDSVSAYQWLLAHGVSPERIVFAGDSAGGGLCLATLLALKDLRTPLPAAAAVLSPWTDLTCSGKSYHANARKCLSPFDSWTAFSAHYVGTADPSLPGISPLFGDLAGLPPLLLYAGGDEVLLDDTVEFGARARKAGVEVRVVIGEGLFHCYPVFAPRFTEASTAFNDFCAFLRGHALSGKLRV